MYECEKNLSRDFDRLARGEKTEEEIVVSPQKNPWEELQSLPKDEYLMWTVGPLLYLGMNMLTLERPKNPHEQLAAFLLKNIDKVDIPKKC